MMAAIMFNRQSGDFWTFNNMYNIWCNFVWNCQSCAAIFSKYPQPNFFISCFGGKRISFYGFCVEAKQCNREFLNRYREKLFLFFCDWSVTFERKLPLAQFVSFACSDKPVGKIGTDPKVRQACVLRNSRPPIGQSSTSSASDWSDTGVREY